MAFSPVDNPVPTSIGKIVIHLKDPDGVAENYTAMVSVDVLDQDGNEMRDFHGDLMEHLNQAEVDYVETFFEGVRTKAQGLLP